ncbi:ribosomal-processing cysteine protease Prp [Thermovenabulum gondwanense]|uniref:Ribosomal processing cysteine protease Prp n=1 Tax=Thermovenabulum gondwanense TaxID=520767 RepID=A0A162MA12_9FIRM|nr:ribosomal-processing cysteine protease Prp [Thermovenabulum gondwanense]KYO64757.1 hypothetical protein ATZ99_18150 [Thermovenabulum gondwanense]
MVDITIWKDLKGNIAGLEIKGHAGYADYGSDIVCAAVSALAETAILGVKKIAAVNANTVKKEGLVRIEIPEVLPEENRYRVNIILRTITAGLEDLAKTYPEYVRLVCREEN